MSRHERFNFSTKRALEEKIDALDLAIELSEDTSVYHTAVKVNESYAPNTLAILPMEGCDSEGDGSPSALVRRRYERFYGGGAGLIWWEANAVTTEGKANALQMMLTEENKEHFRTLMHDVKAIAWETHGHRPLGILQLTHSGRYSRPIGHKMQPIIAQHDPILDERVGVNSSYPIASDEYLAGLVRHYVHSAMLAKEVGFDGVDIKACHRYLLSELLASHTREGRYGGSFENRIRLLIEIIEAVRDACGENFIVACRFNIFDAHPYPYGFGVSEGDLWTFDPSEPKRLVRAMIKSGVSLLSNSAGNPYYIYPQVTRPFDQSSMGIPIPDEHPLESIARLFMFTRLIQEEAGDIPVVGNGYTWLRQYMVHAGSANLKNGHCAFVGMGRSAFAYPDAPSDVLRQGFIDGRKCCTTCSKCTQIMRDHGRTGCVIRDSKVYAPLYKESRDEAEQRSKA